MGRRADRVGVDYMLAMEWGADEEWVRAGGGFEIDSFFEGVRVALVEFRSSSRLPQGLDGTSPFGRGRKQAWSILAAMTSGAELGLARPPLVLPDPSEQDRQLGPGWIGTLGETRVREGIFDASGTLAFRWLEANADADRAAEPSPQTQEVPWTDVTWVRLRPLSSLLPRAAQFHSQILARSTDPNVVYGALTGPSGPEAEVFGLLGTATCSGAQWLERFRVAGIQIKG